MIFSMRKHFIQKKLWLNYEDRKKLKDNAEKTGLTENEYIRTLINGYKPKEMPTEEIFELLKQLRGIGTNLNQIAKKANALNFIDVPSYKNNCKNLNDFMENFQKEFLDID